MVLVTGESIRALERPPTVVSKPVREQAPHTDTGQQRPSALECDMFPRVFFG